MPVLSKPEVKSSLSEDKKTLTTSVTITADGEQVYVQTRDFVAATCMDETGKRINNEYVKDILDSQAMSLRNRILSGVVQPVEK